MVHTLVRLRGGGRKRSEPRHAWDQDKEQVKVYIFLDGIGGAWTGEASERFQVDIQPHLLHVSVKDFQGCDWELHLDPLHAKVNPQKSCFAVRKDRISIKLNKDVEGAVWPKLLRVEHLTMEEIPPLPDAWRADADDEDKGSKPSTQKNPPIASEQEGRGKVGKRQGSGSKEWEAMGSDAKLQIMSSERATLESLLTAASKGDVYTLKSQVRKTDVRGR